MSEEPTTRVEHDSMGEVRVPADARWRAQTQRAIENFPISGQHIDPELIHALGRIKAAAASANSGLGVVDAATAAAIRSAALEVAEGRWDDQFPIDVFQTGSGTSSNMNANEVIAHLAGSVLDVAVHPNDQVNLGQSSNDTIPAAIHVAAALAVREDLLPACKQLAKLRPYQPAHRGIFVNELVGKCELIERDLRAGLVPYLIPPVIRFSDAEHASDFDR